MDVIWEGKEWGVSEAWLELTKILLGYGCDPRIPDHRGILPHQLATHAGNHQMAQLLEDVRHNQDFVIRSFFCRALELEDWLFGP